MKRPIAAGMGFAVSAAAPTNGKTRRPTNQSTAASQIAWGVLARSDAATAPATNVQAEPSAAAQAAQPYSRYPFRNGAPGAISQAER
jgi:hypothetical protein